MAKKKKEAPEEIVLKPRKNPHLWQSYKLWVEMSELRKRHDLRLQAIQRGASNFDAVYEQQLIDSFGIDGGTVGMNAIIKHAKKTMINYGKASGPVWDWLTNIRGLKAGGEAAKLVAMIDDIGRFDTVSKLWRYVGLAVFDGKAERAAIGDGLHYSKPLKSNLYIIGDMFIKHNTPVYRDIYDFEKARQRTLHPEPVKVDGKTIYTDMHIHYMAWRKMIKQFVKDLWVNWRALEGLPVTKEWAE